LLTVEKAVAKQHGERLDRQREFAWRAIELLEHTVSKRLNKQ